MTINLNNYEALLTMYVDNELSATDRKRVEAFLREYPYLQGELELLQQTKLQPEDLRFFNKASLLKPVLDEETASKLLLHLDGELNSAEASRIDIEISANELLNKEWQLLQKTKLNAGDRIEFPYKEGLYRKEEGRVVRMPILRWAVAAAVIGLGFYLGTTILRNNSGSLSTNDLANNNVTTKPIQQTNTDVSNQDVNDIQKDNGVVTNETTDALNQQYAANMVATEKINATQMNTRNTKENRAVVNPVNNKESIATNEPKKEMLNNTAIINRTVVNGMEPELSANEIAALLPRDGNSQRGLNEVSGTPKMDRSLVDGNIRPTETGYAQTASMGFEENDNSVFLMDEENISRSKAGILLKKLKRNVERRANIKPGKSLRIAGFEFAVK